MISKKLLSEARERLEAKPLPPMIVLDVTNTCNLKCIHCPQPMIQKRNDFKAAFLQWTHFTRIVDEIKANKHRCLLRFCGDGEPLLHPEILEMIEYSKKRCDAVINLTTNGILLTPERSRRLMKSGIDLIDISIDAFSETTYKKVRRGGNFHKLMDNISYMLKTRETKRLKTKIMVSFIAQEENQSETGQFRCYWEPVADYVMIRSLHSAAGLVKQSESFSRNRAGEQKRYPCPHLWKRLTIDFDGNIKFCAHDWGRDPAMILGNMEHDKLEKIWQGERLRNLRKMHTGEKPIDRETVCNKCSDWASTRWDYGYEMLIDKIVYEKPVLMPEFPSKHNPEQ